MSAMCAPRPSCDQPRRDGIEPPLLCLSSPGPPVCIPRLQLLLLLLLLAPSSSLSCSRGCFRCPSLSPLWPGPVSAFPLSVLLPLPVWCLTVAMAVAVVSAMLGASADEVVAVRRRRRLAGAAEASR